MYLRVGDVVLFDHDQREVTAQIVRFIAQDEMVNVYDFDRGCVMYGLRVDRIKEVISQQPAYTTHSEV